MKEETRHQINAHIHKFRAGDKKSELFLYERYKKRVKFYVYKNNWFNELKDPENLIEDILRRLFNWFSRNEIEKNEKTVIYDIVRSKCEAQGMKDKREPASTFETVSSEDDNMGKKVNKYLLEFSEKVFNDNFSNDQPFNDQPFFSKPRVGLNLKLHFFELLSKCLGYLTEQQQKVLDFYMFHGYTFREIGGKINRSYGTARNITKNAIYSLTLCFKDHGINSLSDLK